MEICRGLGEPSHELVSKRSPDGADAKVVAAFWFFDHHRYFDRGAGDIVRDQDHSLLNL